METIRHPPLPGYVKFVIWPFLALTLVGGIALTRLSPAPSPKPESAPVRPTSLAAPSDPNRMRVEAYLAHPPANAAPLDSCSSAADQVDCYRLQVQFIDMDWKGAWRGDLDSARAVAACLADGCRGSVLVNPTAACAWTVAINNSADADLSEADRGNLTRRCSYLDAGHQSQAADQTATIETKVRLRKAIVRD